MKKLLPFLLLFSIACIEDTTENESPLPNTGGDPTETPTTYRLPTKITYTTSNNLIPFVSIINYNGNKITDIRKLNTNEVLYEFTYNGNNITKIKSNIYEGFSIPQYYTLSYENERLKNIVKDTPNASDQESYTNYNVTLDWISNTHVKFKVPFTSNAVGNSYVYYELFFDDNGNLIKSTSDRTSSLRTYNTYIYTYNDQINAPFKNLEGFSKLNGIVFLFAGITKYSRIFPGEFFFSKNNLTKINLNTKSYSANGNLLNSYDYEYNYYFEANNENYTKSYKASLPSNFTTTIDYEYGF